MFLLDVISHRPLEHGIQTALDAQTMENEKKKKKKKKSTKEVKTHITLL